MTTAAGRSPRQQDPVDRHNQHSIDGNTDQLLLPLLAKAGLYCTATRPPSGMSGLLAAVLCVAVVITVAAIILAGIEGQRSDPVVSHPMLLLAAGAVVAWIAALIVAHRDRDHHSLQALRSIGETVQARQQELSGRQDHLARRISDLANRQAEQMNLLRQIAADMVAVRREMADVIGVADADAELQLRQAVNDNRPPVPGLYVVPPES